MFKEINSQTSVYFEDVDFVCEVLMTAKVSYLAAVFFLKYPKMQ